MNSLAIERERERMAQRAVSVIRSKVSAWPGGITHREIAERSGLSKNFVTRFLNERAMNPSLYSLAALGAALDCRLEINKGGGADWTQDWTAHQWVKHVLDDMVPKLSESAFVCQIVPDDREGDVKFWVELGASIMLDKPIVAVVLEGRSIPKKLRMIADEIVVLPEGINPDGAVELQEAFERVLGASNE